jgi:hypothetical protein
MDESTVIQDEETIMTEQNVVDKNNSIPDQQEADTLLETKKKSKNSKKKRSKDKKKKKKLPAVVAPEFVRWERRGTMLSAVTIPESLLTEEDRDEVEEKDKSRGEKKKKRKAKKKKLLPVNPPDSIDFVPDPDFSKDFSNMTIPRQLMNDEHGVEGTSHQADWRISEISLRGLEICNGSLLGPL